MRIAAQDGSTCSDLFLVPMADIIIPALAIKFKNVRNKKFRCPTCEAQYKVVRVEAPPDQNNPVLCLSCGGPLQNREGKFALKYFRVDGGPRSGRMNDRKPKFN